MYYFCTYFDHRYLVRGLALYRSLCRHAQPFVLYALCLDDRAFQALHHMALPQVIPIPLEDLERADPALPEAKQNRSLVEYYFTCTPSWCLYLLRQFPDIDILAYVDADLFFYSSPQPVYREFDKASILIVEHRFPPEARDQAERWGIFNVGLVMFRNDDSGRVCLEWWRERCLEWCYDRPENGRFADQKYLDDWPSRFKNVHVLKYAGAGLGPWNIRSYSIQRKGQSLEVEGEALIFYHFHSLKVVSSRIFEIASGAYGISLHDPGIRLVYEPYLRELRRLVSRYPSNHPPALRCQVTAGLKSKVFDMFSRRYSLVFGPWLYDIHLAPAVRQLVLLKRLLSRRVSSQRSNAEDTSASRPTG